MCFLYTCGVLLNRQENFTYSTKISVIAIGNVKAGSEFFCLGSLTADEVTLLLHLKINFLKKMGEGGWLDIFKKFIFRFRNDVIISAVRQQNIKVGQKLVIGNFRWK